MEDHIVETSKTPKTPNEMKEDQESVLKRKTGSRRRFLGVRQRPSGRWVAEIKDSSQKLRLWLGTFDQEEEAALAYDSAARVLRGKNAKTNFPSHNHDNNNTYGGFINETLLRKNPRLCHLLQQANIKKMNYARSISRMGSMKNPSCYENMRSPGEGDDHQGGRLDGFDALVEGAIACNNTSTSGFSGIGAQGVCFGGSSNVGRSTIVGSSSSSICCSKVYSSVVVAPSFSVGDQVPVSHCLRELKRYRNSPGLNEV